MTVYHKHGGQLGYSGHVLNLPQNILQFIKKFPVNVSDLPVLTVTKQGASNTTFMYTMIKFSMHYNGLNKINFTQTLKWI